MAVVTDKIRIDDVALEYKKDTIIVRLANGTALEINGKGDIGVYLNHGAQFSHSFNVQERN